MLYGDDTTRIPQKLVCDVLKPIDVLLIIKPEARNFHEDRARFDPARSHGMAGRILEGFRRAEGGNGAARSSEVVWRRAQQCTV